MLITIEISEADAAVLWCNANPIGNHCQSVTGIVGEMVTEQVMKTRQVLHWKPEDDDVRIQRMQRGQLHMQSKQEGAGA